MFHTDALLTRLRNRMPVIRNWTSGCATIDSKVIYGATGCLT